MLKIVIFFCATILFASANDEKTAKIIEKLRTQADTFASNMLDELKLILVKSEEKVLDSINKAVGVDVSECTKSAPNLDKTIYAVIIDMSKCIVEKVDKLTEAVKSNTEISGDLFMNSQSSLESCKITNGLKPLEIEASLFFEEINDCIEKKKFETYADLN